MYMNQDLVGLDFRFIKNSGELKIIFGQDPVKRGFHVLIKYRQNQYIRNKAFLCYHVRMKETAKIWGVVVIGGGPAGMMAAGRAAELGAEVLLIEKNDVLGKKLLITGGGRCNVTNAEFDNRKLLDKFKGNGKFLFSAFSQYAVKESLEFFNSRNMPTKVEAENRVFPTSNKSSSVLNVLVEYMKEGNVTVLSNSPVAEINKNENEIQSITLKNGQRILAKSFIVATGGKAYPETGSTGDGFVWLKKLGHNIVKPDSSLVPVKIKDKWVKDLQGITLPDVKISIFQDGEKQETKKGKILFTHFGVSGPTILNLSKDINALLSFDDVIISLDILPKFNFASLNTELQDLFKKNDKKKIKNALPDLIPAALVAIVLEMAKIDPDTFTNSVTREERIALMKTLKDMPMQVDGLLGLENSIVSSGGVSLEEIDFKTMRSRLFPNLYVVGDMLNIDRPSGGYSLQLCWTTGFVAGTHAVKH